MIGLKFYQIWGWVVKGAFPPPSFPRRRESIPGTTFDKTEPAYYHRPMATTRNTKPQPKETPHTCCDLQSPIYDPPCPQLAIDTIRQNPTKSDRNSCVRAYLLSAESRSAPNNRPRPHDNRTKPQNEKDQKCPPSSSLTPQNQPKTPQTTRSSASPSIGGNGVGGLCVPCAWGMDSRLRGNDVDPVGNDGDRWVWLWGRVGRRGWIPAYGDL